MKKLSLLFCAALNHWWLCRTKPNTDPCLAAHVGPLQRDDQSGTPSTNAPAIYTARAARDNETQTIAPDMRGGITVLIDNQLAFPNGSGTASSNSTLSDLQIPLTQ